MYSVLYTLINVFLGQVYLVGCLHPEKVDCTQKSTLRTSIYYILHSEVNKAGCYLKHESRTLRLYSEQNRFKKWTIKRRKCEIKTN